MAAKQDSGETGRLGDAAALAAAARAGTLATVENGQPHAALVTPAFGPDGAPLLLLSTLSIHTRQLAANPACCLLLTGRAGDENPQTTPRLSLSGRAAPVAAADAPAAGAAYLAIHPYAEFYAGFTDFAYWRLSVEHAHYIGGFAAASRLDAAALQHAIIIAAAAGVVDARQPRAYD